jgi:hypothetical protein
LTTIVPARGPDITVDHDGDRVTLNIDLEASELTPDQARALIHILGEHVNAAH